MKLTVVAGEFPYPPTHGGRVDMWRRLQAFAECGVELQLICWFSERWGGAPTEEDLGHVSQVVSETVVLEIEQGLVPFARRLRMLPFWPSHASARVPSPEARGRIMARVEHFSPDAIWLDSIWGRVLARRLSSELGVPYFLRTQNREARYMAGQARRAPQASTKIRLGLNTVGLRRFEIRTLRGAAHVFDISVDDLAYWRGRGIKHNSWLPPIVKPPLSEPRQLPDREATTVTYVGNLHTPNNVQGLLWFATQVWPQLLALNESARLVVAGSRPVQELVRCLSDSPATTLISDPAEVTEIYADADLLVNPVLFSSGVNVKSLEMLSTGLSVVSTSAGVAGLPPSLKTHFHVEDSAHSFALAIDAQLRNPSLRYGVELEGIVAQFDPRVIQPVVRLLRERTQRLGAACPPTGSQPADQ